MIQFYGQFQKTLLTNPSMVCSQVKVAPLRSAIEHRMCDSVLWTIPKDVVNQSLDGLL